jgi:hypothetical protein
MMPTNDKNCTRARSPRNHAARIGLTTLEFVACTVAVIGGAWLGALYLGVDVRHLAHTALVEADLLDNVPASWRPPAPSAKAIPREELEALLRDELGTLRHELASLRSTSTDGKAQKAATAHSPFEPNKSESSQTAKEATLAYWQRISDIAHREAAFQQEAETAANEKNAAHVFAVKARISRFAAKSVEAVPANDVDESVTLFARHLAVWYEHGGELYQRAVSIWETPVDSQTREQLNQEWRRADLHRRNEAKLLNEKAIAIRATVSRQFGVEFPEFGKPMPAKASADRTAKN